VNLVPFLERNRFLLLFLFLSLSLGCLPLPITASLFTKARLEIHAVPFPILSNSIKKGSKLQNPDQKPDINPVRIAGRKMSSAEGLPSALRGPRFPYSQL